MRVVSLGTVSLVIAALAEAQGLTVSAVTPTGLMVSATGAQKSLPPSTVVTTGANLSVSSPTNAGCTGAVSFTLSAGAQVKFSMVSSATGTLGIGLEGSASGPHTVDVLVTSPVRVRTQLTAKFCGSPGLYAACSTVLTAGTNPPYQDVPAPYACSLSQPVTKTFPLVLDPAGVKIRLEQRAFGASGVRPSSTSTSVDCVLEADPTDPCVITRYGADCGISFGVTTDLLLPKIPLLTVSDPRRPVHGWLLVGSQRLQAPISPACVVYNDVVVLVPIALDSSGVSASRVGLPPIPGLHFLLQAATFDYASLITSLGIELLCP